MLIVLLIVLVRSILATGGDDGCIRRYFDGQDSFVCVCSLNQCPEIESIQPVPKGFIYQWTSSRDIYRFHKSKIQINNLQPLTDELKSLRTIEITLNPNDQRQKIIGFGSSFNDGAGFNLEKLSIDLREQIMVDYFSKSGLDFSLVRIPIGGTDFSIRPYSYDDNHDDDFDLEDFQLAPEDISLKIPMIKQAIELRANGHLKLLASCWSPPGWMKTNDSIVGGYIKGSPGGKYYKTYAKYHVKFLDSYKSEGINFWGITTTNEPFNVVKNAPYIFNNVGLTPEMLRDFIKLDLGPILQESDYGVDKLNVLILDDKKQYLPQYTEVILTDPETAKFVTGIAVHWYDDGEDPYEYLSPTHDKFPNYFIMSTEATAGYKKDAPNTGQLGNWTRAEEYAYDMIQDFQRYVTGWIDWTFVSDSLTGGPSWNHGKFDSSILVDPKMDTYYRNPMFYALGHFSKFIPPNSVYIGHNIQGNSMGISCATFIDPSQQLVIVLLNTNDHQVNLIVNNFTSIAIPISLDSHSITTLVTPSSLP